MTFRGSKTGENFHNTDVVKVGFASVNYQQSCFVFNFQGRQKSASCTVFFCRPGLEIYEAEGRQFKICLFGFFLTFGSRIFFWNVFFCSLLVEQEISLGKKNKTPTDQTAQIPRRKSRRRRRTLRVSLTSSPMPKLVQFFGCRADEDTVPSLEFFRKIKTSKP